MSHQIELSELMDWAAVNQKMLFAVSSKERKRLYANIRGSYEVHHKGKLVWEGTQPFVAVEKYNEI